MKEKNSDPNDVNKFDLLDGSCVANNLAWINLNDAANGASDTAEFNFQSFRFPNQNSFFLHCSVYMCYSDEDCTVDCGARRRRSTDLNKDAKLFSVDDIIIQDNGLPGKFKY